LKTVFAYLKQSPLPCGNASATAPALGHAAQ
jgi:hypothetical protein